MKNKYLYDLIKSLSKGEKRQLNVVSKKQNKDSLGTQLYQYIHRKKGYDDNVDKKIEEILVDTSRPDQVMSNLASDISLSLSIQNNYSQRAQVYKLILEAEFYNSKNLHELMLKSLQKAKKIAMGYEYFHLHIQILGMEITHYSKARETTVKNPSTALKAEQKELLDIINNFQLYKETYRSVVTSFRKSHETADKTKLQELIESDLLNDITLAKSLQAKGIYYKANMMITHLMKDSKKGIQAAEDYLDLLEAHPIYSRAYKIELLPTYSYYLSKCIEMEIFEGFEEKLESAFAVPTNNEGEEILKYKGLVSIAIDFYLHPSQDSNRLYDYLPLFEEFFEKNKAKIGQLFNILIALNMSHCYFLLDDLVNSKRWIEWQRNNHPKGLRVDVKVFARVLEQFIDLESGLFFLVKSRIPGIKVALENYNQYGDMEKAVLGFLAKYSTLQENNKHEEELVEKLINTLKELKKKLSLISKEEKATRFIKDMDYERWADKKIIQLKTQATQTKVSH